MRREDQKRVQAVEIFKQTGNVSETARRVGVHRTTLQRWLAEPGFLGADAEPIQGFPGLIPKALQVLDDALEGKPIKPAQIRAALEVVKASNALREQTKADGESLADLIAKLDLEAELDSD